MAAMLMIYIVIYVIFSVVMKPFEKERRWERAMWSDEKIHQANINRRIVYGVAGVVIAVPMLLALIIPEAGYDLLEIMFFLLLVLTPFGAALLWEE